MNEIDDPLIVWPLYEPPSRQHIALDARALKQHLLILGSTGSGKTTLLRSAAQQLIRQKSRRIGLLVLDAKQDDTVEHLVEVARQAGREEDVVVLGSHPKATHVLDLFGQLKSFEHVQTVTRLLMLSTDPVGGENLFWQNSTSSMLAAALTILVSRRDRPVTYSAAIEFMRRWFFAMDPGGALPKPVSEVVERAERESKRAGASPQLASALDQVAVYRHLDSRTRSNLQACLCNILRPLTSAAAQRCFDANDRLEFSPALAAAGRLCFVSVNALVDPDLARFVLRLARQQLFDLVQLRQNGADGLCGVVADEFALISHPDDADQLATLRSRNCFVLAATQSLSGLDRKLGERLRRTVVQNFNTIVFMRTREVEAGEFATLSLGQQLPCTRPQRSDTWADSITTLWAEMHSGNRPKWICGPGDLGKLQAHQGYVVAADGSRTEQPVWFAPWFELVPEKEALGAPRRHSARYIEALMLRCGRKALLPAELVQVAVKLDEHRRDQSLQRANDYFRSNTCSIPNGLDQLPACWLAGLPGILRAMRQSRRSQCPHMIRRVECEEGVLVLHFADEQAPEDEELTLWDELRVLINRNLYPSRWRPLHQRHRLLLLFARPDLRSALDACSIAPI